MSETRNKEWSIEIRFYCIIPIVIIKINRKTKIKNKLENSKTNSKIENSKLEKQKSKIN